MPEIKDKVELDAAIQRLHKLQAMLSHTEPGKYPKEEELCIELFDSIEAYYQKNKEI